VCGGVLHVVWGDGVWLVLHLACVLVELGLARLYCMHAISQQHITLLVQIHIPRCKHTDVPCCAVPCCAVLCLQACPWLPPCCALPATTTPTPPAQQRQQLQQQRRLVCPRVPALVWALWATANLCPCCKPCRCMVYTCLIGSRRHNCGGGIHIGVQYAGPRFETHGVYHVCCAVIVSCHVLYCFCVLTCSCSVLQLRYANLLCSA
jgi:hypothetical protein